MFCEKCGQQITSEAVFCIRCGNKVGIATTSKTKEDWMLEAIKDKVLKMLKAPGTAVFSSFYNIEYDEYGRTYAEIAVDSQNAFGATLRTKFGTVFANVKEDALPTIVWEPTPVSFIVSAKTIKVAGKLGKPPKE